MFKLIVLVLFIAILISAGLLKALAFLGLMVLIMPCIIMCIGAAAYCGILANARRNSEPFL